MWAWAIDVFIIIEVAIWIGGNALFDRMHGGYTEDMYDDTYDEYY